MPILQFHNAFRRELAPVLPAGHVLVQPTCISETILKCALRGNSCRPWTIISTLCGANSVVTMSLFSHKSNVDDTYLLQYSILKSFFVLGVKRHGKNHNIGSLTGYRHKLVWPFGFCETYIPSGILNIPHFGADQHPHFSTN